MRCPDVERERCDFTEGCNEACLLLQPRALHSTTILCRPVVMMSMSLRAKRLAQEKEPETTQCDRRQFDGRSG